MPTRKDKTNVAPIYREQVFIPASGATLMKQKARPKVAGRPVSSGAIEIVSPEFDLLTGVRGLVNMIKPNRVYANIGNNSVSTNFFDAKDIQDAVKSGIKEAREYVRHPVVQETVEHNRKLAERIFGEKSKNMGWWENGTKRVAANNRGEVLQHYVDRPVNIKNTSDLPEGWLGDYNSSIPRIRFKSGMSPYDTKRTVFHEGLHHSGYGNFEGGLYDLKAEKLFGIDDYLLGHEAAVHTAELGRIMGLELGQKYPGLQVFKDMITKYNVPTYDKQFIFNKAILNTPRDYKRLWDALTGKYFTTAGVAATGLNLTNTNKMKCGGRRKAQLGLDIREGGIAIPIANNMFYIKGRKHSDGGVAIGPNNKNGIEVEGDEIVQLIDSNHPNVKRQFKAGGQQQTMRVFSSVPFLRGVSPAELVLGGANPDTVFKAQENFKDKNHINDDGTRFRPGGEKKTNSAIRTEADKNVSAYNRAVYSLVDPTMAYPTKGQAFKYGIGAGIKALTSPNDMMYTVTDSVSDAGWRKRVGLSYDDKFLIPNEDGSVRLPKDREAAIPTDTLMLKNRIAANQKLAKKYPLHLDNGSVNPKREVIDWAIKVDQQALDGLTHTYKTGEPVTINEGAYNNRQLIKDGQLDYPGIMPLNILQNYTVRYNPKTKQLEYSDVYDFNEFEWGVPGKPFNIRGSIPVKKFGGNMIYTINGNVKNSLMSIRPKAEWGKEKKINSTTKIGADGLIYTWGPDGNWYTDGTRYEDSKYYMREKSVLSGGKRSDGSVVRPKQKTQSLDEIAVSAPKINKQEKPISEKEIVNNKKTINSNKSNKDNKDISNSRPQYYAEKRLPIAGNKSIAEKAGLARSGWSYADNSYTINGLNYNIPSITEPKSSTPRRGGSKSSGSATKAAKATSDKSRLYEDAPIGKVTPNRPNLYIEGPKNKAIDVTPINAALVKGIDMSNIDSSSTGSQPQSRLIGQYKSTNVGDWIGLGTNVIGSLVSYFINKDLINKLPMPQKPVMAPTVKLKSRHNIEPQLTESREAELSDIAAVERNVASSNVAVVRRQKISNRARQERAGYYGQKENDETQLINQDRLNRQTVIGRNVAAYNDWLNRVANMKLTQSSMRSSNINNLISGLVGGAGDMLSRIENRRATNNALRAIAAANPNVDARLIGGFDYYTDMYGRRYDKNGKLIKR